MRVVTSLATVVALLALTGASASADIGFSLPSDIAEGGSVSYTIHGTAPPFESPSQTSWTVTAESYPVRYGPCATSSYGSSMSLPITSNTFFTGPVYAGWSPIINVMPGPFSLAESFVPRQADPRNADAPDQSPAGRYYACGWLEDPAVDPTSPAVATAQQEFTIREPHIRLKLSGPRHARLGKSITYTATIWAEVGGRRVVAAIQPPSVHRCPREVTARVPDSLAGAISVNLVVRGGGPFKYRLRVGAVLPRRLLVCAGVYDPDSSGEEAAAQRWVTISRR